MIGRTMLNKETMHVRVGDVKGHSQQIAPSVVLSPKIIYFDSMKNLTHATKDMNIIDSLKASIFILE